MLPRDHEARDSLLATIKQKKDEIETYSSRQERDKEVAGPRVAYLKERQRKSAVAHRAASAKEREP